MYPSRVQFWIQMALIKKTNGWGVLKVTSTDPDFFWSPVTRCRHARSPAIPKVYPVFPPVLEHKFDGFTYRLAVLTDLDAIVELVDRLLSGKDFFCPRGQHIAYFKYKTIVLCFDIHKTIGWAVRQKAGSLIHLLVDPDYRGKGIGTHLLKILEPLTIRSKSDQSTGDPFPFYEKHGYVKTLPERIGKNKNIDLLSKSPSA